MGIFKDMLYQGVRKREAQEEYERNHPRSDYSGGSSGGSSRPRRVKYKAYCKKCGTYTHGAYSSASEAVERLQSEFNVYTFSGMCGKRNHLAEVEKVEE
ncbi:MAG: hypothetical protein J5857_03145 [Treponema sp.]|nr:hypothetical protein [Treponema sp.]